MTRSRPASRTPYSRTRRQALPAAAMVVLALAGCQAATASSPASAQSGAARTAAAVNGPECLTQAPPACYPPQVIRTAYGISPLLDRGINGRGQTVVLPEVAETGRVQPPLVTDIRQDLADFDRRFGLPPARVQVITTLAGPGASPWLASSEEVQDTELVHAVAPGATIVELPADPADGSTPAKTAATFATEVRIAVGHGDVISLSDSFGEHFFTSAEVAAAHAALQYAAARHVTFVAGSGDHGTISDPGRFGSSAPVREVSLPASDPLVLAAGGTSLTANPVTGAYLSETAWTAPPKPTGGYSRASGGGFSHLFTRPAYQDGVPGTGAMRGVPDVAADALSATGMAIEFSVPGGGDFFIGAGGTSAAAPLWAGLIALADQQAGHPLGFVNPALYRIARGPLYHQAFHDITAGNNTVALAAPPVTITGYQAGPGWDPVTGLGTPDAQVLIPLLAR